MSLATAEIDSTVSPPL